MAGLIVLVIILGLTLLLLLPVGIKVRSGLDGLKLWYVIGPVRILHRAKEGKKKSKKKRNGLNIRKVFGREARETESAFERFRADLKLILALFGYLCPRIRIKRLELNVILAGDSPSNLALSYGGAWAAIGGVLPILEEAFILQKRDLNVTCDFSGDATTVDGKLDLRIGLGRLLFCLIRFAVAASDKTEQNTERR